MLHSTDSLRSARAVPSAWKEAAARAGKDDWFVYAGDESAAGMSIENNFGLTVGHVALRYSSERIAQTTYQVGRQLALAALLVFLLASAVSSLALVALMRRFDHEVAQVESALAEGGGERLPIAVARGPLGALLRRFAHNVQQAEEQIAELRARLQRGASPPAASLPDVGRNESWSQRLDDAAQRLKALQPLLARLQNTGLHRQITRQVAQPTDANVIGMEVIQRMRKSFIAR